MCFLPYIETLRIWLNPWKQTGIRLPTVTELHWMTKTQVIIIKRKSIKNEHESIIARSIVIQGYTMRVIGRLPGLISARRRSYKFGVAQMHPLWRQVETPHKLFYS